MKINPRKNDHQSFDTDGEREALGIAIGSVQGVQHVVKRRNPAIGVGDLKSS